MKIIKVTLTLLAAHCIDSVIMCSQAGPKATGDEWKIVLDAIRKNDAITVAGYVPSKIHPTLHTTKPKPPAVGETLMQKAAGKPNVTKYFNNVLAAEKKSTATGKEWKDVLDAIANDQRAIVEQFVPSKINPLHTTTGGTMVLAKATGKPNVTAYFYDLLGFAPAAPQVPASSAAAAAAPASGPVYDKKTGNLNYYNEKGVYRPNSIGFYDKDAKYYDFTNFAPYEIEVGGKIWPTTEHYFQAQKFTDPKFQEAIRAVSQHEPREAFNLARTFVAADKTRLRADWEDVRFKEAMLPALRAKFRQYPQLRALLLSTGDRDLVELAMQFYGQFLGLDFDWGYPIDLRTGQPVVSTHGVPGFTDKVTGRPRIGMNLLGKALMIVRAELQAEEKAGKAAQTAPAPAGAPGGPAFAPAGEQKKKAEGVAQKGWTPLHEKLARLLSTDGTNLHENWSARTETSLNEAIALAQQLYASKADFWATKNNKILSEYALELHNESGWFTEEEKLSEKYPSLWSRLIMYLEPE